MTWPWPDLWPLKKIFEKLIRIYSFRGFDRRLPRFATALRSGDNKGAGVKFTPPAQRVRLDTPAPRRLNESIQTDTPYNCKLSSKVISKWNVCNMIKDFRVTRDARGHHNLIINVKYNNSLSKNAGELKLESKSVSNHCTTLWITGESIHLVPQSVLNQNRITDFSLESLMNRLLIWIRIESLSYHWNHWWIDYLQIESFTNLHMTTARHQI